MFFESFYKERAEVVLEAPAPALTIDAIGARPVADDQVSSICLSFKFRLLPTRAQHRALGRILEDQRQLYNAALSERIDCYRKTGKGRTYIDQCKAVAEWRSEDVAAAAAPANLQRWTLRRLDDAYKAFFRRLKGRSGSAGFPRFRGNGRFNSFGFAEFSGIRFDGKRLRFNGLPGGLRVHLHRPLPEGRPLSCVLTRNGKLWSVAFQMRVPCAGRRAVIRAIGIDVGLSSLATLSTGETIPNPRVARRAEKELRRRLRALARCKRGSNRRKKARARVARLHRKVADCRTTYLHQVSANLINRFDLIAVEKLNVKGLAGSMFAKSIHDASWGRLRQLLAYKAEWAGCELIEVDPRNTSQACSGCGVIVQKSLAVREHSCADCNMVLDRDHNAAINILRKAVVGLGALKTADCRISAPGNLKEFLN